MSISIGKVSKSWLAENDTVCICKVDTGYGPEKMAVCSKDTLLTPNNNVLIIDNGRSPLILAAVLNDVKVPIYLDYWLRPGPFDLNVKVRKIPGTNIIEGMRTDADGVVLYNDIGFAHSKVSGMPNAQICVL